MAFVNKYPNGPKISHFAPVLGNLGGFTHIKTRFYVLASGKISKIVFFVAVGTSEVLGSSKLV